MGKCRPGASRKVPPPTHEFKQSQASATPERRLGWGGAVKKLRAMEICEKQTNRYQVCLLLFNNNVDLKNNKVHYRKFVSILSW